MSRYISFIKLKHLKRREYDTSHTICVRRSIERTSGCVELPHAHARMRRTVQRSVAELEENLWAGQAKKHIKKILNHTNSVSSPCYQIANSMINLDEPLKKCTNPFSKFS
jgi:hypothetical protein